MSYAVIGAGYGDEGKGKIVDYLAREHDIDYVVRYSGGANAGHTVMLPDGTTHIFHHFGSGALAGIPTFLGPKFICNPLLFDRELKELEALEEGGVHVNTRVTVSAWSPVTTFADMLINEMIELKRGSSRHGSTGSGINETITRMEHFPIDFSDLTISYGHIEERINEMMRDYVPRRLEELEINRDIGGDRWDWLFSDNIKDNWIFYANKMWEFDGIDSSSHRDFLRGADVIFEGSQGLLLDEDYGFFPHVTRGSVGLKNIMKICDDAGIELEKVYYVARSYATRHGDGPFPNEEKGGYYNPHETNVENQWQGSFRTAPHDFSLINDAITKDMAYLSGEERICRMAGICRMAVNHLDIFPGVDLEEFVLPTELLSRGPRAADVTNITRTKKKKKKKVSIAYTAPIREQKFFVGDRVRVVVLGNSDEESSGHEAAIGEEFVIRSVEKKNSGKIWYKTSIWTFYEHEIELVMGDKKLLAEGDEVVIVASDHFDEPVLNSGHSIDPGEVRPPFVGALERALRVKP